MFKRDVVYEANCCLLHIYGLQKVQSHSARQRGEPLALEESRRMRKIVLFYVAVADLLVLSCALHSNWNNTMQRDERGLQDKEPLAALASTFILSMLCSFWLFSILIRSAIMRCELFGEL